MAKKITIAAINKVLKNNEISYRGKRFTKCTGEVLGITVSLSGLNFLKPKISGKIYTPCWDYTVYYVGGIWRIVIKDQMFNIVK